MHIQRGRLSLPSPHAKHGALLLLPYAQWQLCCVNIFSALTDMCKSSSPHAPASVPCPLCSFVLAPNPPPLSLSLSLSPTLGDKAKKMPETSSCGTTFPAHGRHTGRGTGWLEEDYHDWPTAGGAIFYTFIKMNCLKR